MGKGRRVADEADWLHGIEHIEVPRAGTPAGLALVADPEASVAVSFRPKRSGAVPSHVPFRGSDRRTSLPTSQQPGSITATCRGWWGPGRAGPRCR